MFRRLFFPLIALFWLTMNVLLWRAEFGSGREAGAVVSSKVVWQKILTAPDDSTMEISWNGKKLGYCRWVANIGEALAGGKVASEDDLPEGMIKQLTGYTIDFEGNLLLPETTGRLRFSLHLKFARNQLWQELTFRATSRPNSWELRTVAAERSLRITHDDDESRWSRTFTYDQLRNPRRLVQEFGGPFALAFLGQATGSEQPKDLSLGLKWEARNDWMKLGHSQIRVYRLQAHLFDKYQAIVWVSRVGEIMRVELPNGILLVNEALTIL